MEPPVDSEWGIIKRENISCKETERKDGLP